MSKTIWSGEKSSVCKFRIKQSKLNFVGRRSVAGYMSFSNGLVILTAVGNMSLFSSLLFFLMTSKQSLLIGTYGNLQNILEYSRKS